MAQMSTLHQSTAIYEMFTKEDHQPKEVKRRQSIVQQPPNGSKKTKTSTHWLPSAAAAFQETEPLDIRAPRDACLERECEQLDRTPAGPTRSSASESWDASGDFDTTGGVLRLSSNANCQIEIPEGAIAPSDGVINVRGRVSLDVDLPESVQKCLKDRLTGGDFLASPVVRCAALVEGKPNFKFQAPVTIIFPHFLSVLPVRAPVRIYQINFNRQDEMFVEELRLIKNVQDDAQRGTFYFGEKNKVHAVVDHFSNFCLISSCEGACPPEPLDLELYAGCLTSGEGSCNVTVRLEIKNSRLDLEDHFKKDRGDNFSRMVKKDYRRMAALQSQCLTPGNAMLLKVILSQPGDDEVWQHRTDLEGRVAFPVVQVVPMELFQACKCKWFTIPEIVQWELTTKSPSHSLPSIFRCYVTAAYVRDDVTADASTEVKMSLTIPNISGPPPFLESQCKLQERVTSQSRH